MSSLAEALKFTAAQAVLASTPVEIKTADRLNQRFAIRDNLVLVDTPAPVRDHKVKSLDDLVAIANRFSPSEYLEGEEKAVRSESPRVTVWYSETKVTAILNDDDHRDERVTLSLEYSDVFQTLKMLAEKKPWYDQKPFVRLLRIDLADTIAPGSLLNPCRKIKWVTGSNLSSNVSRGGDSMGRDINAAVSGETEIPEEVSLAVTVYKTLGLVEKFPLKCAVEIDHLANKFQLVPFPDQIEFVGYMAIGSIEALLNEKLDPFIPFYYGCP